MQLLVLYNNYMFCVDGCFLGEFEKLRKAFLTLRHVCLLVRLFVLME